MDKNPFAPDFKDLPESLPVFPLSGVLLLPGGRLPLNIFEKRYLKMVDDAMATSRMIGMIQPREESSKTPELFSVGCAGKITEFNETDDGRYMIALSGICRFKIAREMQVNTPYRQVQAGWTGFEGDLNNPASLDLDRKKLQHLLEYYFKSQDMSCDWNKIHDSTDGRLITCLSMICPFDAKEKQALLEAPCGRSRAQMFMTMLEMALHKAEGCGQCH